MIVLLVEKGWIFRYVGVYNRRTVSVQELRDNEKVMILPAYIVLF